MLKIQVTQVESQLFHSERTFYWISSCTVYPFVALGFTVQSIADSPNYVEVCGDLGVQIQQRADIVWGF